MEGSSSDLQTKKGEQEGWRPLVWSVDLVLHDETVSLRTAVHSVTDLLGYRQGLRQVRSKCSPPCNDG